MDQIIPKIFGFAQKRGKVITHGLEFTDVHALWANIIFIPIFNHHLVMGCCKDDQTVLRYFWLRDQLFLVSIPLISFFDFPASMEDGVAHALLDLFHRTNTCCHDISLLLVLNKPLLLVQIVFCTNWIERRLDVKFQENIVISQSLSRIDFSHLSINYISNQTSGVSGLISLDTMSFESYL